MVALLTALSLICAPIPREPRPDDKSPGDLGVEFAEVANGIHLNRIHAPSPAQRAGLLPDDVIVKYDGKPLGDLSSVQQTIFHTPPHTVVPIEVQRGDKTLALKIRIGYRPPELPELPLSLPDEDGNDFPAP